MELAAALLSATGNAPATAAVARLIAVGLRDNLGASDSPLPSMFLWSIFQQSIAMAQNQYIIEKHTMSDCDLFNLCLKIHQNTFKLRTKTSITMW